MAYAFSVHYFESVTIAAYAVLRVKDHCFDIEKGSAITDVQYRSCQASRLLLQAI